jgi:hypothetical protein
MSVIIMCCRACSVVDLEKVKNQQTSARTFELLENQIELLKNLVTSCPECNQIGCPRGENHENQCSGKPQ